MAAIVAAGALMLTSVPVPASAFHPDGVHWGACANALDSDCIVSVLIGSTNGAGGTAPGTAPYGGITADVFTTDDPGTATTLDAMQMELRNNGNYELDPVITSATEVTVILRFGGAFDPAVVLAVGDLVNWTWDAADRELTIIAFPGPSSWAATCSPDNCPSNALFDNDAMFLISIDDTKWGCCVDAFSAAYVGGYIATNAQFFAVPFINPFTSAVEFMLGAPHFKTDGTTVNTGRFEILIPDPVISGEWGKDPATLDAAALSVTVGGAAAGFSMTRVTGRAPLPDGWRIESTAPISFSTPTISIAPVSASAIVNEPFVPVTLPETVTEGSGPREFGSTVRVGRSGTVAVPVTVTGVGAQLGLATGTKLSTSLGAFAGDIIPPFNVADPTGGKLASVTALVAHGLPGGVSEVSLSQPATLTLPVPPGGSANDYQPVQVDPSGKLTYLTGTPAAGGVALSVGRLDNATMPWQRAYGLAKIPEPAVLEFTPALVAQRGHHSRWAGQSGPVELAPGAMADLTVRLLNAGDQPWVKGVLGKQANLGSSADGSTAAVDSGLVIPLWGRSRFATTNEDRVAPGEHGTFTLRVRAPSTPGTYRIYTRPVIDGVTWLTDEGIYLEVTVR